MKSLANYNARHGVDHSLHRIGAEIVSSTVKFGSLNDELVLVSVRIKH